MKARAFVQSLVALTVLGMLWTIVFSAPLSVTASIPTDETPAALSTPSAAQTEQMTAMSQPGTLLVAAAHPQPGANPNTAQAPTTAWQFIGPNESHWYKMSDAGLELVIWLDAHGQAGLSLAIYAPEQTDLYGKPIGRGSFNKFQPTHDLYWTGYTRARGTWYAVVTNGTQSPISYNLNYKRVVNSVAGRCSACHGFEIEWDRCVSHGNNWCEDLKKEYDGN
jgi:hypothetical protein